MNSKISITICLLAFTALIMSFTFDVKQEPWAVPDNFAKKANPVKADASSTSTGKSLWAKHCQSCHGKQGKGDGSKAAGLKTKPGDFTSAAFKGQSDGALFYKTQVGRKDMPSFKKKIPDEDEIWSLVNYMRTFK